LTILPQTQPEKEKDTRITAFNQPSPKINHSATTKRLLHTSHSQNISDLL
jgi:hypothetical protein